MTEKKTDQGRIGRRHMGRGPVMGIPVEKAKDFKSAMKRLIQYFRPQKYRLTIVLITAVFSTTFSILSPKVMGKATTKIFEGVMDKLNNVPNAAIDYHYISRILIILAGLYIISGIFSYVQGFLMAGISQKIVFKMRNDVNHKISRLPLKYFDSRTHGEILSRVTNDIDNIANTLQQSLTQLIISIITIVGIVIMMFTISPTMTFICLATLPLYVLVTKMIASRSQKYFVQQQKVLGDLNGHVEEMFTGHEIIKAYGHECKSIEIFNNINDKLYDAGYKAQFISGIIMPLMNFINNVGYVLVSVAGGILVTKRSIEIGDVQAFIQYSRQFTHPIVQTANIANILQSTLASAERVFELLDEEEEVPDKTDVVKLQYPRGEVVFKDVKFRYKKDVPLINNMNITVKPGQTVAIVGPTGAGKTTIVNLLMRFYECDGGIISIDGVDITVLKREDLRRIFGMVLQDTWLFNGSIRDNIAYGCENSNFEDVVGAAKTSNAHHFITTLPDGYNTILNEEASNISQGQKQLLTIARAVLANPSVLILDEATSNVDTRTEIQIQRAMNKLMQGRTSFVIAHRLSTIRDADLILVMKDGDIIEQGDHLELLKKNGFYAELYNSQFNKNTVS